ncbi:MAG: transglutaminase family protein [Pseudoxanthomonas sp.]
MKYDVRLRLRYEYDGPVADGRHLVRVLPRELPGVQQVAEAQLRFDPAPEEQNAFTDYFGNRAIAVAIRAPHTTLDVEMRAQVRVDRSPPELDLSPDLDGLRAELAALRSLSPDSPAHFLPPSARVPPIGRIADYAAESLRATASVFAAMQHLGRRIHKDFAYDAEATEVDTPVAEAFDMRRGVCQDFSHIMIAGLRGLGVPAGYVSGFLRTQPPPGQKRLEGADATHAWVAVWCGPQLGWQEFDPTNGIPAGDDHITIGYGRDYGDVAPMVGVLKASGGQEGKQAVDVIPLE